MNDLPPSIRIHGEGPREGFRIEPGPVATADKIALVDALSATGVPAIQVCSFVSPRRVPGWHDAEAVVAGFAPREGVRYDALWFNERELRRALPFAERLTLRGSIALSASEPFSRRNLVRDRAGNLDAMRVSARAHLEAGIAVDRLGVMAAFGCNFAGEIEPDAVVATIRNGLAVAADVGAAITELALGALGGGDGPRARLPALPLELDDARRRPGLEREPPAVGEHSRELLTEAGLDTAEIDALAARGIVVL